MMSSVCRQCGASVPDGNAVPADKAARIASDAERLLAGFEYSVASSSVLNLALRSEEPDRVDPGLGAAAAAAIEVNMKWFPFRPRLLADQHSGGP